MSSFGYGDSIEEGGFYMRTPDFDTNQMCNFTHDDPLNEGDILIRMPEFITNQLFGSREELMNWVKNLAYSLGVVIVTRRSNKRPNGFVYKVVLKCDRGRVHDAKESSRVTGTKRMNCPFELEGKYIEEYDSWTLKVICDGHNHPLLKYMEGHPYAKRLSRDEFGLVSNLSDMEVAPRNILSIIKERNPSNVSTLKTIYNARHKIRMSQQVGKSPMQVLMSLLNSQGYVYEYTTSELNQLESLFFIHPTSFDIWRAFPHLLIIDATYKTNQYNMPFVQIVGVTSTGKTFSIAFAFIHNEKEPSYTWVMNCLKSALDKCMLPRVIVTDREKALMNACDEVFPSAAKLLCSWHIWQNIIKNCRQSFRSIRAWETFHMLWNFLEYSITLESYEKNYKKLESFLLKYPRVLTYVNDSWLNEYKNRFVSFWIDQHLNFGENTTNRVESQHAKLKKYLEGSKSSLDRFLGCIHKIVQSQQTAIKESLEQSRIIRIHQHNLQCFKLLRGFVSNEALKLIIADRERWKTRKGNCGCRLRKSCGLPCACELSLYMSSRQYISLDSIDPFWKKLDISPSIDVQDDDVNYDDELRHFAEAANNQSKNGKRNFFKRLRNIWSPSTTEIREPQIIKQTRGRPSLKKSQQKKHVDTGRQYSHRFSCSTMPNHVGFDSIKEPARHSSYEFDLNKEPMVDLTKEPTFDLNEFPVMDDEYIFKRIPKVFHTYIRRIQNVETDGNCGYRSFAAGFGLDETEWYEYIRQKMREEFESRRKSYELIFVCDVDSMYQDLCFFGEPCPEEHWMKMPEAGVLIANKFGVIVHSLSILGSSTIFPFWSGPEDIQRHKAITIALIGNHYVMVELQGEYPMPPITPYWNFGNISSDATRWEVMYRSRLDLWTQLCPRQTSFVNID